ncbi:MAG: hydroxymethylbilane synthase [Pseudoclavibacter sp.]|nr:hydroxymethylbilane synthase [Pseudoclavibacter sp.]
MGRDDSTGANGVARAGKPLRIGTRGSALAVAQTERVAARLRELTGRQTSIVRVTTHGDVSRASLSSLGGTGVFATELREALREGACDLVVHSLKDLPTAPAPGLVISAHPAREDVRDALCAGGPDGPGLRELPGGARVGTGSPRRVAQLRALRPDLEIRDIRGNIDTRLGFVSSGELDAVLLACAGLERLGRTGAITRRLDPEAFPPAPGQGCLAVEQREGETIPGLDELDDPACRAAVEAERGVLAQLQAGCAAPVAALATTAERLLRLSATVYAMDGTERVTATASVPWSPDRAGAAAREAALRVSEELFARGAAELLPPTGEAP